MHCWPLGSLKAMVTALPYVVWFEDPAALELLAVGGKNAALAEMTQALRDLRVPVPEGFALTTRAFRELCAKDGIGDRLQTELAALDTRDVRALEACAARCRSLIYEAPLPVAAVDAVRQAYAELTDQVGADVRFAVRSSATAEDLPSASFAGQHDSFLNVTGEAALLDRCKRCLASLFTDRAIRYREERGFDHRQVALSVGIMRMVRSEHASSGVLFTLDTESGHPDVILLNAAYGLGETIVQGAVDPDEFYVHKPTFEAGYREVLRHRLGAKQLRMVCDAEQESGGTCSLPVPRSERCRYALTDAEVLHLCDYGLAIERYYAEREGHAMPMDIEWAKDGPSGVLYVVQARPETVLSQRRAHRLTRYRLLDQPEALVAGRAVGQAIATGPARLIRNAEDLVAVQQGDVLIAESTAPAWGAVLKKAAAIVTDRGGRTCHAAIVARELGIPAVVGCGQATDKLAEGAPLTVSCAAGERGYVFAGAVPFETSEIDLEKVPATRTKLMLNLADPDSALSAAMLPNDGVGLARMEFIVNNQIGAHPMALAHPERVGNAKVRTELLSLAQGHASTSSYFVHTLAESIGMIAAAFYPKPVIARLSDFKSNEYRDLLGGETFEPVEENPMIGFRGASRYISDQYRDGFALECQALARVRSEFGLKNLKIMVPFCRRVAQARAVLEAMASFGLERGNDGLEIYMMCEIPNNVILIDEFAPLFDGLSIGSNDLTQLTLGVDRDSEALARDFDERDPGVLKMLELAVIGAHRNERPCGICGQAPSDYPELAEFLVRLGIDSLSLSPDSIIAAYSQVSACESTMSHET